MKCVHCHQKLSNKDYVTGYCPTSPNSFHQVVTPVTKKMHPSDAKIGAVGGE